MKCTLAGLCLLFYAVPALGQPIGNSGGCIAGACIPPRGSEPLPRTYWPYPLQPTRCEIRSGACGPVYVSPRNGYDYER
jgi:hypothetical protein